MPQSDVMDEILTVGMFAPERQVVDVHYLGVETELNYLPLFSELALLLPNTHINLTIFSPATHALPGTATRQYPRSIAVRAGPVWEYTAPRSTGGSSIAISLYREKPRPPILRELKVRPFTGAWDRSVYMLVPVVPAAVVAPNAGILGHWRTARGHNIPFACTDYAQQRWTQFPAGYTLQRKDSQQVETLPLVTT
ncbi:hypothetical protein DFH07DRAFT_777308 [Mycena maculata]|uniref:Mitochondrial splicing suppressor 51-like C-terminal domain-containing protein n=1 Tax=Mycena maculata TaxID=230809 RepID=A0AAD7N2N0_9AGAR|nr:hypothetical protein DFH07DRAFT_777308 [Mycena maculata]